MADFSASNLIQQVVNSTAQSNAALTKGAEEFGTMNQQAQDKFTAAETGLQTAIAGTQEVAANRAAVDYLQESTKQRIQRLYGMDPEGSNFYIADQLAKADKAESDQAVVRAEYDRLSQVDFMSNPLGWIVAQTKLPQIAATNNNLVDQEEAALQRINARTTSLEQAKKTVTANTADMTRMNQLKEAEVQAQISNAKLAQSSGENIVRMAASKMQQIQISDKVNDNTRSAIGVIASIQNAEETRRLRASTQQADLEGRELRRIQLRQAISEEKAKEADIAEMNARLAIVSTSLGQTTPMTVQRLKTLGNKAEQDAWLHAAATQRYGEDLQGSVIFFQKQGSFPNIQASGGASVIATARSLDRGGAEYVPTVTKTLQTQAATTGGKLPSTDQIRAMAYDQYQNDLIQSTALPGTSLDLANSRWDKVTNPYVAPLLTFSKVVDTQPDFAALKNNAVKKQIDTLVKAGVIPGENLTAAQQQQVMLGIQAQVATKKITPQQAAADITQFYKQASEYNLRANKYDLFALPKQENYLFTMPGGGQQDLFNPAKVENAIVRGIKNNQDPIGYSPFSGFR